MISTTPKKQWMILQLRLKGFFKLQFSMELINYIPTDIIELKSRRIWMTDVYECTFFNSSIEGEIKNNLMKRVIANGMTN